MKGKASKTPDKRKCYRCKESKPLSEMEEMGVWVCKECLNTKKKK
jgi:ribosomal protein L37AE/L43A